MPFKRVNPKKEIRKSISKNPILADELAEADKKYEDKKNGNTTRMWEIRQEWKRLMFRHF